MAFRVLSQPKTLTRIAIGTCAALWLPPQILREEKQPATVFSPAKKTPHPVTSAINRNTILTNAGLKQGRWWLYLTNSFQHADVLHIGLNTWVLAGVGPIANALYGGPGFVALWVGGAVVGNYASLQRTLRKGSPSADYNRYMGASAAIYSLIAANVVAAPTGGGIAFLSIIVGATIFLDRLQSQSEIDSEGGKQISHMGHLGGLAFGLGFGFLTRGRMMLRRR